jgi:hypothetical protein
MGTGLESNLLLEPDLDLKIPANFLCKNWLLHMQVLPFL